MNEALQCSKNERFSTETHDNLNCLASSVEKGRLHEFWSDEFYVSQRPYHQDYKKEVINGIEFTVDGPLKFYRVTEGQSIDDVRATIASIPEFSYVNNLPNSAILSFNLRNISPGLLVPVPLKPEHRTLSNRQLINATQVAIERIKSSSYAEDLQAIIGAGITEQELSHFLFAIARQESGSPNGSAGEFVYHRWEDSIGAFSFGLTHVLMGDGPGRAARDGLQMTEGQTMHPVNGLMMALAFIIEKTKERNIPQGSTEGNFTISKFPIARLENGEWDLDQFARFYNGNNWADKDKNPNYVRYLSQYLLEAQEINQSETIAAADPVTTGAESQPQSPERYSRTSFMVSNPSDNKAMINGLGINHEAWERIIKNMPVEETHVGDIFICEKRPDHPTRIVFQPSQDRSSSERSNILASMIQYQEAGRGLIEGEANGQPLYGFDI